MSKRNFTKLFRAETGSFLSALNLSQEEKDILLNAKQEIRESLKTGLRAFSKKKGNEIEPRFLSQGSSVYKTQNRPNHVPPQQIDHDFGCYLPFSYLDNNGSPKIAAVEFFAEVDFLLEQLAKVKKYKGIVKTKSTCSRLVVNDRIHIDVPLYSVPDSELQTITEAAYSQGLTTDSAEFGEQYFDFDFKGPVFTSDRVFLAHRIEGWKVSDPRKLNMHFKQLLKTDELLRRICRYVKAFRDEKWNDGGPSSISLMILASAAKAMGPSEFELEQDALLFVLRQIPSLLQGEIENPTDRTEKISVSAEDKAMLARLCNDFTQNLEAAIHREEISDAAACGLIQDHLGNRFPRWTEVPKKNDLENKEDEAWKTVAIKKLAESASVRPKPYYYGK